MPCPIPHTPNAPTASGRNRRLARLLPLRREWLRLEPVALTRLVAVLRRALRRERARGCAGHWTYDRGRHAALREAYMAERGRLERMRRR